MGHRKNFAFAWLWNHSVARRKPTCCALDSANSTLTSGSHPRLEKVFKFGTNHLRRNYAPPGRKHGEPGRRALEFDFRCNSLSVHALSDQACDRFTERYPIRMSEVL